MERLLFFFYWMAMDCHAAQLWGVKHMDKSSDCVYMTVHNDNMLEGDYFQVYSDQGNEDWHQYPAECHQTYNLGDRRATMTVKVWRCTGTMEDPFLAVYQNCEGTRHNLLMKINCTEGLDHTGLTVYSQTSCLTLYHYRGHVNKGYYFVLELAAGTAILSFSVAGAAAIFVLCIVGLLCLTKVFCVMSGFERRLPDIDFEVLYEEQKSILENMASASNTGDVLLGVIQPNTQIPQENTESPSPKPSKSTGNQPTTSSTLQPLSATSEGHTHHRALRLSRSTGSSISGASSMLPSLEEAISEVDLDAYLEVDLDPHPRLKRYPSAKASSMFRHK